MSRRALTFPCTALIASLAAGPALAEPRVAVEYRYYDIAGWSIEALQRSIAARGPLAPSGRRHAAYTDWRVTWEYGVQRKRGTCRLSWVETAVRVVFTLPRWANAEAAAPEVLQRWHGYYRALRLHEDGHRDNGIEAAREIERSLRDLPAAEACAAIDQSASLAAKDILRKYNARDRDYDAQTRHGATQGATLP